MLAEGMVRTWCFMSLVTLLVGGVAVMEWDGNYIVNGVES